MKPILNSVLAAAFAAFAFAQPAAAEQKVIPIGALFAMSGPAPYYGKVMSQGALMAIDEINAKGGINGEQLKLFIEDHKSGNTEAAVTGMN